MKIKISLLVILTLLMPAISAERSDMKIGDMGSSASPQAYMFSINEMHERMMVAVKEPGPDKTLAEGMTTHHEGVVAMVETGLKYGRSPEMRKLAEDIIKAQRSEIDQMGKWFDNQK